MEKRENLKGKEGKRRAQKMTERSMKRKVYGLRKPGNVRRGGRQRMINKNVEGDRKIERKKRTGRVKERRKQRNDEKGDKRRQKERQKKR